MKAFVCSGGGNRGALEAGAAAELIAHGIVPDLLIGTSAGAINAAYLAVHGPGAADDLAALWAGDACRRLLPFQPLAVAARLAQGRSMFDGEALASFLDEHLPPQITFGDLALQCYVTATDLASGTLYLYGDDRRASVNAAVRASSAHPLLFDPVPFDAGLLVDGGVVDNAPVGVALDRGATEIYLLNAGYAGEVVIVQAGLVPVLLRSLDVALHQPLHRALRDATATTGVALHHMHLPADNLAIWDLDHGADLVAAGRATARAYLAGTPIPRRTRPPADPPSGAVPYLPPWQRDEGATHD